MNEIIGAPKEFSLDRVGIFFIPIFMIEADPDVVRLAMSGMLIVRAERLFAPPGIDYMACSEDFEKVLRGSEPPEYRPILKKVEIGNDENDEKIERVIIEGWQKATKQQRQFNG